MIHLQDYRIPLLSVKIDSIPALFFERDGKTAFAWGYTVREIPQIPTEDCRKWDKGVIWCSDLEEAIATWKQFRMLRREAEAAGGAEK